MPLNRNKHAGRDADRQRGTGPDSDYAAQRTGERERCNDPA
ncbi:hypothetical protein BSU04_18225 [Caballeronia sordidicola]|uniref:Uncharacterized protein n=1 Tax=Caballeronia sordidicola TaxID=196367 RepID=A0A226X247_CABSO|nr:hypothetical protein BSU04_18225 [Caballeronia sordidicola]